MAAVPFREALFDSSLTNDSGGRNWRDATTRLKGPGLRAAPPTDVEVIGPYTLWKRIGQGGMAEVYAATRTGAVGFEREVCLKRILPKFSDDAEFRGLFTFEAQVAGRLCHSNLVQVFDCIEEDETLAIIMEMVDGVDLKKLICELLPRDRSVSAGVVVYIAGQLLSGLRYAHEHQVVHRDVSPHNILVSREGEVKLADFGVAKAMVTHITERGVVKGKLAYMSPEQASGQHVDHRTDLYSTGLVLYELLMGRRFFPRGSRSQLLCHVANAKPPCLTCVEPALAIVIEKLLSPNPDDRFQSAQEALDALPPWEVIGPAGAGELANVVRSIDGSREQRRKASAAPRFQKGSQIEGTETVQIALEDEDTVVGFDVDTGKEDEAYVRTKTGSARRGSNQTAILLDCEAHYPVVTRETRRAGQIDSFLVPSAMQMILFAAIIALLVGMTVGACSRLIFVAEASSLSEISNAKGEVGMQMVVRRGHVLSDAQLDAEALGDVPEAACD